MASCKSYQNRKHEIELLKRDVERLQINTRRLENIVVSQGEEINALKMTIRLYREYVLKAYDPDAADIIEIPNCLKPLDSIKYVGEQNGLNR
jgi:hypothetical protein